MTYADQIVTREWHAEVVDLDDDACRVVTDDGLTVCVAEPKVALWVASLQNAFIERTIQQLIGDAS